jgi:hypothetical protein
MATQQRILLPKHPRKVAVGSTHLDGKRPHYSFDFTTGTSFTRKAIDAWPQIFPFQGQELIIKASEFATLAGRPLAPMEADWLRVALAFCCADRYASRRPVGDDGPTFWRRSIHVTLPVANVSRWIEAQTSILAALNFLTEDDWTIDFVSRSYRLEDEDQKIEPIPRDPVNWVSLFSGGLDSAAGAIDFLTSNTKRGLLVSGNTHNRLKAGQEQFVNVLRSEFPQRFDWLSVHYGLPIKLGEETLESSQRCRGWIHVALGLLAIHLAGLNELHVFENGIGAFNLPCDSSQFGSQGSRAIHPLFFHRMSAVASRLLGSSLQIKNPCLFATKGEMVSKISVRPFARLFSETFSCENFPNRHSSEVQCGVCPSCLVRKASVSCLSSFDDTRGYTWNVLSRGFPSDLKLTTGMVKLEQFVERVESWSLSNDPWQAFIIDNPDYAVWEDDLATVLGMAPTGFRQQFLDVHNRFAREWRQFAQKIPRIRKRNLALSH